MLRTPNLARLIAVAVVEAEAGYLGGIRVDLNTAEDLAEAEVADILVVLATGFAVDSTQKQVGLKGRPEVHLEEDPEVGEGPWSVGC